MRHDETSPTIGLRSEHPKGTFDVMYNHGKEEEQHDSAHAKFDICQLTIPTLTLIMELGQLVLRAILTFHRQPLCNTAAPEMLD